MLDSQLQAHLLRKGLGAGGGSGSLSTSYCFTAETPTSWQPISIAWISPVLIPQEEINLWCPGELGSPPVPAAPLRSHIYCIYILLLRQTPIICSLFPEYLGEVLVASSAAPGNSHNSSKRQQGRCVLNVQKEVP